jgi:hypothetical protein
MGFFLAFLLSLGGLVLLLIPVPVPLFVPAGVAFTGWALAHLLALRTSTDRRLRRLCGALALTTAGLTLLWYLVIGVGVMWVG